MCMHQTQPSIFPGLIFRPGKLPVILQCRGDSCIQRGCSLITTKTTDNSPIVLLIFKSARVVVTGGKEYQDIKNGYASIIEVLKRYFVYRSPVTNSIATIQEGVETDDIGTTAL